jgi:hypothetical protein
MVSGTLSSEDLDDLGHPLALAEQDVGVAELPDDLFWLEPLLRHDLPPPGKGSTPTLSLDQPPGEQVSESVKLNLAT